MIASRWPHAPSTFTTSCAVWHRPPVPLDTISGELFPCDLPILGETPVNRWSNSSHTWIKVQPNPGDPWSALVKPWWNRCGFLAKPPLLLQVIESWRSVLKGVRPRAFKIMAEDVRVWASDTAGFVTCTEVVDADDSQGRWVWVRAFGGSGGYADWCARARG